MVLRSINAIAAAQLPGAARWTILNPESITFLMHALYLEPQWGIQTMEKGRLNNLFERPAEIAVANTNTAVRSNIKREVSEQDSSSFSQSSKTRKEANLQDARRAHQPEHVAGPGQVYSFAPPVFAPSKRRPPQRGSVQAERPGQVHPFVPGYESGRSAYPDSVIPPIEQPYSEFGGNDHANGLGRNDIGGNRFDTDGLLPGNRFARHGFDGNAFGDNAFGGNGFNGNGFIGTGFNGNGFNGNGYGATGFGGNMYGAGGHGNCFGGYRP